MTEGLIGGIKNATQVVEALERVVRPIVLAVTVGPFVVARGENHGHQEGIKGLNAVGEHGVGTNCATALHIAGVNDERDAGAIDTFHESGPAAFAIGAVLLVTQSGKLEGRRDGGLVAFEELLEKSRIRTGGGNLSVEREEGSDDGEEG